MTPHTNIPEGDEEIAKQAVKSVTREDDGLLDIGKHDHELLKNLIIEALATKDAHHKKDLENSISIIRTLCQEP